MFLVENSKKRETWNNKIGEEIVEVKGEKTDLEKKTRKERGTCLACKANG